MESTSSAMAALSATACAVRRSAACMPQVQPCLLHVCAHLTLLYTRVYDSTGKMHGGR